MKILHDTLKNPKTGRYSRKNITCCLCFTIALGMTISWYMTGEIHMELFKSWIYIGEVTLGITVLDKAVSRFNTKKEEIEN